MDELSPSSISAQLVTFFKKNLFISSLLLIGLICLSIGLIQYFTPKKSEVTFQSAVKDVKSAATEVSENIVVDVSGEVKNPGVYTLKADARLQDALKAAGGFSNEADTAFVAKSLNLASKLNDGLKIYIPKVGEAVAAPVQVEMSTGGQVGVASQGGLVSINNASQSELEGLSGIGPVTAQKIIGLRPYSSIDELLSKKAVGQSVFTKIRDQIGL